MRDSKIHLFRMVPIHGILQAEEQKMIQEIDNIDGNRLLNTSEHDLCEYFEQKYHIDVPKIEQSAISVQQEEVRFERQRSHAYEIFDDAGTYTVTATRITFHIPFIGDKELFKCQPSYSVGPPTGQIEAGELRLSYERTDHDAPAVRREFDRDLASILDNLQYLEHDVAPFNSSLLMKAQRKIEERRTKLLKDQGLVAGLGFPLRRRDDAPQTYIAPTIRRKAPAALPSAPQSPYVHEPTLDLKEYEHILSVMSNMVTVMERSPHSFHQMGEEDLRQHFLVQLNGQYEGQATGETFNFEGKTDILLRVQGKNVFIGECKIWRGPESLRKTLDQLLGYVSWRDTKTAILIFNRDKNFSTVLAKIPEVVLVHPNFKRQLPYDSETGFRFVMHHKDDVNRELMTTVLAFEVPK